MFGLKQQVIESMNQCFGLYPEIDQVVIYGSRAAGNYKTGSDIDLMIIGAINYQQMAKLENELDDLMLPYKIDLSVFNQISNPDLLDRIERAGKIFYDATRKYEFNEVPMEYKAKYKGIK